MRGENILAVGNTIAFVIMIATNALANILPINGLNTGEVSNLYPSLFTPAGITFSIWSVIYFLLLGFVILQWQKRDESYFDKISFWFIISCLLNCCWILSWHYLMVGLSLMIMICLLFTLVKIFLVITKVSAQNQFEHLFFKTPFTIYLAWICVATIANCSAFLVSHSWHGGNISESVWTIIMMIAAVILCAVFLWNFRAYAFAAVIIWALLGIAIKHLPMITNAAFVLIVVTIAASIIVNIKPKRKIS
jgi:benzodiazapine receptor